MSRLGCCASHDGDATGAATPRYVSVRGPASAARKPMPSASPSMSAPYPPTQNRVMAVPSSILKPAESTGSGRVNRLSTPRTRALGEVPCSRRGGGGAGRVGRARSVEEVVAHDDLLALGADADHRDARVAHPLERVHVVLRVLRQLGEAARLGDV